MANINLTKGPSMSFYPEFILSLSLVYPDFILILSWFYPDSKDWPGKKVTILLSRFLMVKSSEMILFFYLHFTWFNGHKIIKEFWKNIHFWEYDNCFSYEVSKLTSVRNKLNLPLKYWFMEVKDVRRICYGPNYCSKYHLDTIQTIFSEINN